METFIGGLIGGLLVIAYMLFRINRSMEVEYRSLRKDTRAAQAQVEKPEAELEKQKAIATFPKSHSFSDSEP